MFLLFLFGHRSNLRRGAQILPPEKFVVPKTLVFDGPETASVNRVFSVVCRGPWGGVDGLFGRSTRCSLTNP